jgi:ubiquinone/menaquinone biosynthesis C-methylase UbiE
MSSSQHDSYAAEYDAQVRAYDCYLADVLFGMCFEYIHPGERLLDAGIGSGLSAILFAKAGLSVHGMDFSPVMLELCRLKGFAAELKQHDVQDVPWPYPAEAFDHVVCCGVMHFIPDLETIFGEVGRVIRPGGIFAFTTKAPPSSAVSHPKYYQEKSEDFDIYSHYPAYLEELMKSFQFERLKGLICTVGQDAHIWISKKS